MRLPGMRQIEPAEVQPKTWRGARRIAVLNAAGGAGASTLCALLAREIAGSVGPARDVGIIDNAEPSRSPWTSWTTRGLDPDLGDQGTAELWKIEPTRGSYPVAKMRRACGAVRGLAGVAVVASTGQYACALDVEAASASFAVAIIDIAFPPYPETADFLADFDGDILLAIAGTADGISAGHRALRAWADFGLPPEQIRPVVIGAPGNPSARVMSRLALAGPRTTRAQFIPHDPAIARRGLVEAIAADALRSSTRCALRDLVVILGTRAAQNRPASSPARMLTVADLTELLEGSSADRAIPRTAVTISEGIAK